MFEPSPLAFPPPENPKATIWRYLDFTKFVSMLETSTLHFTRPDRFGDPFEGTVPEVVKAKMRKFNTGPFATKDVLENHKKIRTMACVNCWHMNEHESEAMWKLYLKSDEGIAVRSTYDRLTKSFDDSEEIAIHVGMVRYIDYRTEDLTGDNLLSAMMHKRKSFEHEREVRALGYGIYVKKTEGRYETGIAPKIYPESGVDIPVKLKRLIEAVYVSPTRSAWFKSLVESVVRRYKLKVPVHQSDLESDPVW